MIFREDLTHTLLPVSCNVLCWIPYCICLLLQRTDMKRRLFYSIFFAKTTEKEQGLDTSGPDNIFLNELKNTMRNLFLRKNVLILFWRKKKKENLFQMFDDLGGKREKRRIFLHRSVFFIARGSKISPRFLTLVAPLGLLISFISFSLLTDDDSILCLSLSFFFLFHLFLF